MSNNNTSDLPIEQIERICQRYRLGIITSERAMAQIVTVAGKELLRSVKEQEASAYLVDKYL